MSAADLKVRKSLPRLPLAAAAGLALLGAVLVLLLGGGSPGGTLGPADALAQAAQQTAAATSGVATTRVDAPDGATMEVVTRFQGADGEALIKIVSASGQVSEQAQRVVDGVVYVRTGDGAWEIVPDGGGTEAVAAEISNQGLVDLVKAAAGVTQSGDAYTATVPASALAGLDDVPLGISESPIAEGAPVQLEVAGGLVRSITVATQAGNQQVTYSELNQPQSISAPSVG